MAAARRHQRRTGAHVALPASGWEAVRFLTSSPGAAASTSFYLEGEVVGANGSRAPVTDSHPARPRLKTWAAMDIRKFFGVIPSEKKPASETVKKNEKTKSAEETFKAKKGIKEIKVNSSCKEDDSKQKQPNKKKRVIYDSDSESEETVQVKNAQKEPEKLSLSPKPGKIIRTDPVTYISETDEEDDFVCKKAASKSKENGGSTNSYLGATNMKKNEENIKTKNKPLSPIKLTPTSVLDYFGTGSVQRSDKKMVASKRKEPSQNADDSRLNDEAIAKQLQLDEDAEIRKAYLSSIPNQLERQLHEDEEFARTLAMLDEEPKNKKARKDQEERETFSSVQANLHKTEKHKSPYKVKTEQFLDERKNYSPKKQTKHESSKESQQYSKSSPYKIRKTSSPKASSKLTLLKKKGESSSKETEPMSSKRKENAIELKETKTPKKTKSSPAKKESVSPEDSEKRRTNYQAYRSFLNREGPKALGSKEIPKGAENCLEGLIFVITGVLESIERDEAKSLIERYGGKVTGNVSKKTNYLVMGRDSGQSKSDKAAALGTKIIDEDGLLDLIRTMPGKKSKYEIAVEAEMNKGKSRLQRTPQKNEQGKRKISPTKKESESKRSRLTPKRGSSLNSVKKETSVFRRGLDFKEQEAEDTGGNSWARNWADDSSENKVENLLWVDKYKPTSLKTIIGQQGDQSCANKLLRWLQNWHKRPSEDKKHAKFGKFAGKDDGSSFKAALLSGPPGVGKTTTASLVCQELGYSYVELNASDTRSKNSLKEIVAESLNNTSIRGFYSSGAAHSVSTKHALIMDEVDGMAGTEDRGGIQELIGLIKHTKIPIICMCNDRNHPKIRSLVHYCFDLRFQRPRVEQIKGAMMSIAFKEGLKIPPPAMNEIILGANQDIRQVLHNLSMWCARSKALTYDQAKADSHRAKKDIKLGPFDVARKVFATGEETAHMSLVDKSDLFFHDYSIAPLFVQENYLHVKPVAAGGDMKKHLMLLSRAADSICDGDLVDRQIRSRQNWSLLPTQAIYASVLPGELMRGYMTQFPSFPSWLGKHSSTGKHDRIIQDLALHMSLSKDVQTGFIGPALDSEYNEELNKADSQSDEKGRLEIDAMIKKKTQPLISQGVEGVQDVVALMDAYYLMKEDFENIMEISSWGGKPSPFSKLDPKVKAAFTRAYNKEIHLTPYSLQAVKTSRHSTGPALDSEYNEELNEDDSQSDEKDQDTTETDAMIKKKTKSSKSSKSEKDKESRKGKGKSSKK
ncbi:Replication factor C subunit 1 [Pteropus alecto]|uniref:Replication factor C subunit 1 n=1 Tax=Pteropus alecto TaxID=9402 RepID=L5K3Z9_PTEAL|nr:Replication factor C subunit 1 [Pteropus alecto]